MAAPCAPAPMHRCLPGLLLLGIVACSDAVEPAQILERPRSLLPPPSSLANRIVFLSLVDLPDGTGEWRLFSMDTDGTDRREVPVGLAGHIASPDVAPDGLRVAFVHERSIYTVRADGGDLRRIASDPDRDVRFGDFNPRWSPDGTALAFSSGRNGGGIDLHVIGADGSDLRRLTFAGEVFMGSWSPDGRRLAFTVREGIASRVGLIGRDGSDRLELPPLVTDDAPDWSPDGLEIAYQSFDDRAIHVIGLDGSNDRRLSPDGLTDGLPRWSPDGRQILFLSVTLPHHGIAVSRADGSQRRQLSWGRDSEPDWGPVK